MKITRATLLKAAPYAALIAGFAGGALAISPMSPLPQTAPREGDPYLQLVQAQPLPRAAPTNQGQMQLSFAPVAGACGRQRLCSARHTRHVARSVLRAF